jgi:hypothetical protein
MGLEGEGIGTRKGTRSQIGSEYEIYVCMCVCVCVCVCTKMSQ